MLRKSILILIGCLFAHIPGYSNTADDVSAENLIRAMRIADAAFENYFHASDMKMYRYYNPYNGRHSSEIGSVWMYTSSIETVNAILAALDASKDSHPDLYRDNFDRYCRLLEGLYTNLSYYEGTFELVSFTRTKSWTVYAVNRASEPGAADCSGILNVYDDQMWLIRELVDSYRLTGKTEYLHKAEYLTEYVLDGWDPHRDSNGNEIGGIPWGPGYSTKHSCSNGPMILPLVELYELYKGKPDLTTVRYIDRQNKRQEVVKTKAEYYFDSARKIYDYQYRNLLRRDGVYADMMGGISLPQGLADELKGTQGILYEVVDGVRYKASTHLTKAQGRAYTYNSGTMLSGAAALYSATGESRYYSDLKELTDSSFSYFAQKDAVIPGYYSYGSGGFSVWFDCVLMKGYVDAYGVYEGASVAIASFQDNLDYGYDNYLYRDMLPSDLLGGWSDERRKNYIEAMFTFAFATEYAVLSKLAARGDDNGSYRFDK